MKSGDTKETAEKLKQIIPESTYVMTLQNGVSNEETLVDILGKYRVLSVAVYVQAAIESPGVIKQAGESDDWSAHEDGGQDAARNFTTLFNEAKIPSDYSHKSY